MISHLGENYPEWADGEIVFEGPSIYFDVDPDERICVELRDEIRRVPRSSVSWEDGERLYRGHVGRWRVTEAGLYAPAGMEWRLFRPGQESWEDGEFFCLTEHNEDAVPFKDGLLLVRGNILCLARPRVNKMVNKSENLESIAVVKAYHSIAAMSGRVLLGAHEEIFTTSLSEHDMNPVLCKLIHDELLISPSGNLCVRMGRRIIHFCGLPTDGIQGQPLFYIDHGLLSTHLRFTNLGLYVQNEREGIRLFRPPVTVAPAPDGADVETW